MMVVLLLLSMTEVNKNVGCEQTTSKKQTNLVVVWSRAVAGARTVSILPSPSTPRRGKPYEGVLTSSQSRLPLTRMKTMTWRDAPPAQRCIVALGHPAMLRGPGKGVCWCVWRVVWCYPSHRSGAVPLALLPTARLLSCCCFSRKASLWLSTLVPSTNRGSTGHGWCWHTAPHPCAPPNNPYDSPTPPGAIGHTPTPMPDP